MKSNSNCDLCHSLSLTLPREDVCVHLEDSTSSGHTSVSSDTAMLAVVIKKIGSFLQTASKKTCSSVSFAIQNECIPLSARQAHEKHSLS